VGVVWYAAESSAPTDDVDAIPTAARISHKVQELTIAEGDEAG
jgi:hypothetical protein